MVFTIRENSVSGTILFQTTTALVNKQAPEKFFGNNSFKVEDEGVWVVNKAIQREGNFAHYAGSNDRQFPLEIYLYGTNRYTNMSTIANMKNKILYFDMTDKDSNLTGTYYISSKIKWEYDDKKLLIKATMTLSKYNN